MSQLVIVGLGSNIGSRSANLRAAIALLREVSGFFVEDRSPLYETPPLGPPQPHYLNAALRMRSELGPRATLEALLAVERRLGRTRDGQTRWGPRSVDLDLLYVDGVVLDEPGLTLPHPQLTSRAFALRPLIDVAPELRSHFAAALDKLPALPSPWLREPTVAHLGSGIVAVEADDLVDACAWMPPAVVEGQGAKPAGDATLSLEVRGGPRQWLNRLATASVEGVVVEHAAIIGQSDGDWRGYLYGRQGPARRLPVYDLAVERGVARRHRLRLSPRN